MSSFDRIPPRASATTAAEQSLRKSILAGRIAPGEKLPPERKLAVMLGVSRLTLRAALAMLAAAGLISVKHGSGYVVSDYREKGGSDLLGGVLDLASEAGTLPEAAGELLRVRRYLAAAVFEALAERPPRAAARRAVRVAVDRFAEAVERGASPDELAAADLAVVRTLLDATGGDVLGLCLNPIITVVSGSPPLRAALYADPGTNLFGWRALTMWIESPLPDAVPALMATLRAHDAKTVSRLTGKRGKRASRDRAGR